VVKRSHLLALVTAHGQHQYRHGTPLAQLGKHLVTLAIGQADIQDDQVWRLGRRQGQSFGGVGGQQDLIAFGAQTDVEKSTDLDLVVDDQDAWC
jgi:hypothetical protein